MKNRWRGIHEWRVALVWVVVELGAMSAGPALQAAVHIDGRACLLVEQPEPTGEPPATNLVVFDQTAKPGPGKRMVLQVEADIDCRVLAVAFNAQDHTLANGWRPQLAELEAWEEQRLPLLPASWEWTQHAGPFDFYVVFVGLETEDFGGLRTLVEAMQQPEADPKLLDLQARKLHETLHQWMGPSDPSVFHAGTVPAAWGGVLRSATPPWRHMAQKVLFDPHERGIVIFRYDH